MAPTDKGFTDKIIQCKLSKARSIIYAHLVDLETKGSIDFLQKEYTPTAMATDIIKLIDSIGQTIVTINDKL